MKLLIGLIMIVAFLAYTGRQLSKQREKEEEIYKNKNETMKNKWNTTLPPVSDTGKSQILCCKAVWDENEYYAFAFFNENTKEWTDVNTRKPVQVVGWKEIE